MGSINAPMDARIPYRVDSTGINGTSLVVPANSFATVRFVLSEILSQYAALRSISVPSGIVVGTIGTANSNYVDVGVYNATASSITLTGSNANIRFIDFDKPSSACVMMSDGCYSPGPSPK